MTRINTNVSSLIAQRVLGQNNQGLTTSLERLSTGLRINRGKDDPAGLIASQNLRAEKAGLSAAISNAERADQVVNIAEGGLTEVSGLLTELQSLVTATANTAGLSLEEKEANQLQIDSILQTIDRVAASTSFQGIKLLDGNFDYATSSVASQVDTFKVNGAKLEFNGSLDVEVVVTQSAQVGGFLLSFGGSADLASSDDQFVIEIAGALGSRELSFASGTTTSEIVETINTFTDVTGVTASVTGADNAIRLESTERAADQFVSVKVVDDGGITSGNGLYQLDAGDADAYDSVTAAVAFSDLNNTVTDEGQDVEAFINGVKAVTSGTRASISTEFLNVELDLEYDPTRPSAADVGAFTAFTITGGGADFQLAGNVDIAGKVGVGIKNVATRDLGVDTLTVNNEAGNPTATRFNLNDLRSGSGLNVVDGNLAAAQKIVTNSIREVSGLRGRLGAFQTNTIGATVRSLGISFENTAAAESVIRDADFATETASLTRNQVLVSAAQNSLSLANVQPQSALQLLG
jgi:flagellin